MTRRNLGPPRGSKKSGATAHAYVCRYNLYDCIAANLLKAHDLLLHPYPDPGQIVPSCLALFTREIGTGALAAYGDDPQNFLVQVEVSISSEALGLVVGLVDANYNLRLASPEALRPDDVCVLIPAGVSLSAIQCALFRNSHEQQDFLSVSYENIDPTVVPTGITSVPDPYETLEPDVSRLRQAAQKITNGKLARAYLAFDSLGGALLQPDSFQVGRNKPDTREWVQALLSSVYPGDAVRQVLSRIPPKKLPGEAEAELLAYLPQMATAFAEGADFCETLDALVAARTLTSADLVAVHRDRETLNTVVFGAIVVSVFEHRADWSATACLSTAHERFNYFWSDASRTTMVTPEELERYQKVFPQLQRLLAGNVSVPVLSRWPYMLSGLLLFLLRPDPVRVVKWADEQAELGFSTPALLMATAFTGLLEGLEHTGLSARKLARYEWIHYCMLASLQTFVARCLHIAVTYREPDIKRIGGVLNVIAEGTPALTLRLTGEKEKQIGATLDLDAPVDSLAPQLAVAVTRNSTTKHEATPEQTSSDPILSAPPPGLPLPPAASTDPSLVAQLLAVETPTPEQERLAREACRQEKWHDCLRQTIDLTELSYVLERRNGRHVIVVDGSQREVSVIWDRFRARLKPIDSGTQEQILRKAQSYLDSNRTARS